MRSVALTLPSANGSELRLRAGVGNRRLDGWLPIPLR